MKTLWEKRTGKKMNRGGPTGEEPVKRRSLTATDEEWQWVEKRAREEGMSASSYLRSLLISDMKKSK